jgi:glycosyltransferase involved in cell wall biosynthesis
MILGVNGIRLLGKRSGVGRCIEAFLSALGELEHPFSEVHVYTPQPLSSDVFLPKSVFNVVLPSFLPPGAWEQFVLPKAHGGRNLLFCPSYVIPLLASCPTFLVHHGSYEGYPQAFDWWTLNKSRAIYSLSARRATVVSTVSEHSKKDMVRFYGIKPERIHIVPDGVDTRFFRRIMDPSILSECRIRILGSDSPFILHVGKPTERRNISALVKAFGSLKEHHGIPHKLVIVGADQPGRSPFREVVADLGLGSDVKVLGYADHHELVRIYNATDLLVYPSCYEGFGMPVLEAMACGTPVIALNNTAFPEFAKGVATLLPNAEVSTLKDGIMRVLTDSSLRERMREDGPKRAAHYDWRLVTRRYLDLMTPLAFPQSCAVRTLA